MKRIVPATVLLSLLLTVLAGPVLAGARDMLLCLPGFPGTSSQAQPYIDKVLRYLENKLNWEEGSMSGTYLPDGESSVSRLSSDKPGMALVGPSVYVSEHNTLGMKVIAKVQANGRGEETYSVITQKGGASDLASLSGKTLSGAVVHDSKYVYNVLLDQKVADKSLTLISQKRPLKALRDVARGKVDAAIVDQSVVDHMSELPINADLQIIYKSKPVPAPAAVVMGIEKVDIKKIKNALVGMCSSQEGKDLCKSLTITSITSASDADYKNLLKRYNR